MKSRVALALLALLLVAGLGLGGCTSPIPNRNPVGEPFPSVEATSLASDEPVRIPGDFLGEPLLVLVGYVQDAQFDIDRWLFGVLDAQLDIDLLEVPAARGMGARLASGFIDGGMRRGIPQGEWKAVVTTYGPTAEAIARATGTENPRNARVLLLGPDGVIRWFHDHGYSAPTMIELRNGIEAMGSPAGGGAPSVPARAAPDAGAQPVSGGR